MEEKILKALLDHPITKEIEAKQAAVVFAERKSAAAKIETLQKEWLEISPKLQDDYEAKKNSLKKAREALKRAEKEAFLARAKISHEKTRIENLIAPLKDDMIKTAATEIDEAIDYFRGKSNELRDPSKIRTLASEGHFSILQFRYLPGEKESNISALKAAGEYCRMAIKQLEEMKFAAEPDFKVIESLKAGSPPIDEFKVYTDPKPFEGVEGKFLPPASSVESKTDKLLGRARRIMRSV